VIVVDTNIIVSLFLPATTSHLAVQLRQKEPSWSVPRLWKSEFSNVLWMYVRNHHLPLTDAKIAFELASAMLAKNECESDFAEVLELATASGCTSYDCEFVALAKKNSTKLVTLDKKLCTSFPKTAQSLQGFLVE